MNTDELPPLADIFLLLPENSRIIRGETRQIGIEGEASGLRKAYIALAIVFAVYLALAVLLLITSPNMQMALIIIGFFPAIVLAIALFFVRRRYQCFAKLGVSGILLTGRVIAARTDTAIAAAGIKMALRLRYEFTSPQGRRFEREEAQLRHNLEELPQAGTPVAVIYANDDCFRVL